jgi:hypothetical protein
VARRTAGGSGHRRPYGRKIERFEPGPVAYADGELEAGRVIGVPPHRPPAVVAA